MFRLFPLLFFLFAAVSPAFARQHPALPDGTVPGGLGINIHFTQELPGEMKMLAATGAKWIRMDWGWGRTERQKGVYDWSEPDKLVAAMEKHGLRAVFVLSYGNKLYSSVSPATDEARQAFARWAVAAVTHFQGRGILWEIWNEPNLFWTPKPSARDYIELARLAGAAIKAAAPDECVIGPAIARLNDFDLLETYFKGGVLEVFDAVSVHPYRDSAPDTVAADYARLRALIQKYAPANKTIPILSGEWGYTSGAGRWTDEQQARYLARMWLSNLASGIPLSIWYDWRDDGDNQNESEHRYGLIKRPYGSEAAPFEPKPAYGAARALIAQLQGFQFQKRISTGDEADWVLEFARGQERRYAAWTADAKGRRVSLALAGRFSVRDVAGDGSDAVEARNGVLSLDLSPAVIYLSPVATPVSVPVAPPVNPRHIAPPSVLKFPLGAFFIEGQKPRLSLQLPGGDAKAREVKLQVALLSSAQLQVGVLNFSLRLRGNEKRELSLPRLPPDLYELRATARWNENSLSMTHHFAVVSRDLASRPRGEIPRWVGLNPMLQNSDSTLYPEAFAFLDLIGTRHARWMLGWGNIQPTESRTEWERTDAFLAGARARDIELMACLSYWGAPWTHERAQQLGGAPMGFSPQARQFWADSYALPAMKRYGASVRQWQIWNEPNAFWDDDPAKGRGFARAFGSPANYFDLFSRVYDAGHKLDPNLRIMATLAATSERDLNRLFDLGLGQRFDGFIGHTYGNHAARLQKAREILQARGHGDKPLGSGEIGLPADPENPLARRRQAAFVAEVFLSTVPLPNISGVDWFVLSNQAAEGTYGLLDNRLEPTPLALAYFATARLLSGARGGTSQSRGNLRLHRVERNRRAPLLGVWTNDGSARQVSLVRSGRGEAKAWNLLGQRVPLSWRNGRARIEAAQPVLLEGEVELDEPIELQILPAPSGARVRVSSQLESAQNAALTLETPQGAQSQIVQLRRGDNEAFFPLPGAPMGETTPLVARLKRGDARETSASRALDFALAPRVESGAALELKRPPGHPFWRIEGDKNWEGLIPNAYRGAQDLSLEIAFGWTQEHLVLWLEARDDVHVLAAPDAPWSTDSGQLALDAAYRRAPDAPFVEYAFGLGKDGPVAFSPDAPHFRPDLLTRREGDRTFYRLLVPFADLALAPREGLPLGASLIVNDNDGPRRKGWLGWGSGIGGSKNPALYRDLVLGAAQKETP